jgi:hypothetical protein
MQTEQDQMFEELSQVRACVYVRLYVCMYVCMYVRRVYAYVFTMHVHMWNEHMRTYIHTHLATYIQYNTGTCQGALTCEERA